MRLLLLLVLLQHPENLTSLAAVVACVCAHVCVRACLPVCLPVCHVRVFVVLASFTTSRPSGGYQCVAAPSSSPDFGPGATRGQLIADQRGCRGGGAADKALLCSLDNRSSFPWELPSYKETRRK